MGKSFSVDSRDVAVQARYSAVGEGTVALVIEKKNCMLGEGEKVIVRRVNQLRSKLVQGFDGHG